MVDLLSHHVTFLQGDVFDRLKELPSDHFDTIITSPPYWGLRNYEVDGQIGMERTLGEHLDTLVRLCEELKRVLKPSGTFWLNYGDCYATSPNGRSASDTKAAGNDDRTFRDKPFSTIGSIYDPDRSQVPQTKSHTGSESIKGRIVAGGLLKPKDLCMIPNRLAIALQEAGWWVRSEIIWAKPNPMPESVTDRPATSHEKIWLLTKSARYYYNNEAVRMPAAPTSEKRWMEDIDAQEGSWRANGGTKDYPMKAVGGPRRSDKQRGHSRRHAGFNDRWDLMSRKEQSENGRNLRNYEPAPLEVWNIATHPFSEAHFATFPPELVERCIKAGCPVNGTVLDPFGGSGTTALVAAIMGHDSISVELNPKYIEIAKRRIEQASMSADARKKIKISNSDIGEMF